MRKALTLITLLAISTLYAAEPAPQENIADRKQRGAQIVKQMMDTMGADTLSKGRYLRFDYSLDRENNKSASVRHLWDRETNTYRVDWLGDNQLQFVAVFDVNTGLGDVWANGRPVTVAERDPLLQSAHFRFLNDSFTLLGAYKLFEKGVQVLYLYTQQIGKEDYDVLNVSFDTGHPLTGNQFWLFVNRKTHLIDQSAQFLKTFEGQPSLEKAWKWRWSTWRDLGTGAIVSRERVRMDIFWRVRFGVAGFVSTVDPLVFKDPSTQVPDLPDVLR